MDAVIHTRPPAKCRSCSAPLHHLQPHSSFGLRCPVQITPSPLPLQPCATETIELIDIATRVAPSPPFTARDQCRDISLDPDCVGVYHHLGRCRRTCEAQFLCAPAWSRTIAHHRRNHLTPPLLRPPAKAVAATCRETQTLPPQLAIAAQIHLLRHRVPSTSATPSTAVVDSLCCHRLHHRSIQTFLSLSLSLPAAECRLHEG